MKKSDLVKALQAVSPAVGAKDNNLQQNCFVFHGGHVLAYNDDVCMDYLMPDGWVTGDFAVQAKEFLAAVSKLPTEEFQIDLQGDHLLIKAGRSKTKFKVQTEMRFPLDTLCQWGDYGHKLPKDFTKALALVSPACGHDMTKPLSTCVYLNENMVIATDTHCCGRYLFRKYKWDKPVYLPKATADILSKRNLDGGYTLADGWMIFGFDDDNGRIVCRTYYEGQEFVDVAKLYEQTGDPFDMPAKLPAALERAGIFTKSTDSTQSGINDPMAEVRITENRLTVTGTGAIGEYEEQMRIQYNGKPRAFRINSALLIHAIEEKYSCELCQHFLKIYDDVYGYLVSYTIIEDAPQEPEPAPEDEIPF